MFSLPNIASHLTDKLGEGFLADAKISFPPSFTPYSCPYPLSQSLIPPSRVPVLLSVIWPVSIVMSLLRLQAYEWFCLWESKYVENVWFQLVFCLKHGIYFLLSRLQFNFCINIVCNHLLNPTTPFSTVFNYYMDGPICGLKAPFYWK